MDNEYGVRFPLLFSFYLTACTYRKTCTDYYTYSSFVYLKSESSLNIVCLSVCLSVCMYGGYEAGMRIPDARFIPYTSERTDSDDDDARKLHYIVEILAVIDYRIFQRSVPVKISTLFCNSIF